MRIPVGSPNFFPQKCAGVTGTVPIPKASVQDHTGGSFLVTSFAARPGSENGAAQCAVNVPRNLQNAEKYATNGTHSHAGRLS
jgi:hypothetical protein